MASDKKTESPIVFTYKFSFDDGRTKEFKIYLDYNTLDLINPQKESNLEWTKLDNCKCPPCKLNSATNKFCPVALNITEVIDFFARAKSYEKTKVHVITPEREYFNEIPLQRALSSIMGIFTVTSGCPTMAKLKPMVRWHLPFATIEETTFRMIAMYLYAQYFLKEQGKTPDWELHGLRKIYDDVGAVDKSFCQRLLGAVKDDANVNAMVILDTFANYMSNYIDNTLCRTEYLFKPYLE